MDEIYDNHSMARLVIVIVTGAIREPFTKRARNEFCYTLLSALLTVASLVFAIPMLCHGILWAASAAGMRRLAADARFLAWRLLGERVPAPPPLRTRPYLSVRSPDTARFSAVAEEAGGRVRQWMFNYGAGFIVVGLPESRITELAAEADVTITKLRPRPFTAWMDTRWRDRHAWRARVYFAAKLPFAAAGLAVAAGCYLGGLYWLTLPAWQVLHGAPGISLAASFAFIPVGAAFFLAAPWLMRGSTEPDRWLIRSLLGPVSAAERVRQLEETRSIAVDDAAARLRSIERNLHDGAQAQLVAVAMKLGLAREKLTGTEPVDLARITQLVADAHGTAVEAITELRTIVRGIHPPVLDKGLTDALTTLANRSTVPVELVTDIRERPTDAIETIAYFSAAELLANVARHSGARRATLEAVHVPGLLRIRVTDDGHGGARAVTGGGLRGLAERVRTVDGRLDIDSPPGGPTTVTVELPSRA
jgi:signal transduction histidine kinase